LVSTAPALYYECRFVADSYFATGNEPATTAVAGRDRLRERELSVLHSKVTVRLDNDAHVDRTDVNLIMAVRDTAAAPGDPRDLNKDHRINPNDARYCSTRCMRLCSN
jgi:hypothetical protein